MSKSDGSGGHAVDAVDVFQHGVSDNPLHGRRRGQSLHEDPAGTVTSVIPITPDVEIVRSDRDLERAKRHVHRNVGRARVFKVSGIDASHPSATGDVCIDRLDVRLGTSDQGGSRVDSRSDA